MTHIRDDGAGRQDASGRFVSLDGCFNFRDLGGYPTAGGRTVHRGLAYRSDALHRLTARGTETFRALTIATVIDLRARRPRNTAEPSGELSVGDVLRIRDNIALACEPAGFCEVSADLNEVFTEEPGTHPDPDA